MFESDKMAIMPEKLSDIIEARKANEVTISAVEVAALIENAKTRTASSFKNVKGSIAILPLHGFISHRATIWAAWGLESSSELFTLWFNAVINDSSVGAVVIDVNSPGGTVFGLTAVTDAIFNARGKKPIIAVANSLMASAAYFIASSADEIVADPDAEVGSIGTIAVHFDHSAQLELMGVNPTIIHAGKFKAEGSPFVPLDDEAKAEFQRTVDSYYDTFVSAVARNRGITVSKVKSDFGQGRVLRADDAQSVGMVDRVATLNDVLERLGSNNNSVQGAKNELALLKVKSQR